MYVRAYVCMYVHIVNVLMYTDQFLYGSIKLGEEFAQHHASELLRCFRNHLREGFYDGLVLLLHYYCHLGLLFCHRYCMYMVNTYNETFILILYECKFIQSYIHTYMHTYKYTCKHACIHTYIHRTNKAMGMYVCMYVCIYIYIYFVEAT